MPRVGDADRAAGPAVAESLIAPDLIVVARFLEHDRITGGVTEDKVIADGLDLRHRRHDLRRQERPEPVNVAKADRVRTRQAPGRTDATEGGLACRSYPAHIGEREVPVKRRVFAEAGQVEGQPGEAVSFRLVRGRRWR